MRVCVANYNRKADNLIAALHEHGHETTRVLQDVDVLLIDTDIPSYGTRRPLIEWCNANGVPVVIYPHGGDFRSEYDSAVTPLPATQLVVAEGHKRLLERLGYPFRVEVCGWFYSPVKPFRPTELRRVLFAPRHPFANGVETSESAVTHNRAAYAKFKQIDAEKVCRFIGALEPNGIGDTEGVRFIRGDADNSIGDILEADLVISTHTFAAMAVALGKPTVMYSQDDVAHTEYPGEQGHFPSRWADYRSDVRYPYDLDDPDAVEKALTGGPELDRWRTDFIGDPLDSERFVGLLESCLT